MISPAIHIGGAELQDPGRFFLVISSMASVSFYQDGSTSGGGAQAAGSAAESGGRSSDTTFVGNHWRSAGGNWDWCSQRYGAVSGYSSGWGNSGQWYRTPKLWVWGTSLDDGIRHCVARGWLDLDSAFCTWWNEQSSSGSQPSAGAPASEVNGVRSSGHSDAEAEGGGLGERREDASSVSDKAETSSSRKPNTGKEHIPGHDGLVTMREYQKRVRLFESTTSIDPEYQAGKLLERLSGVAWECTETLDVKSLKHVEGVQRLLDHLWSELEPLEHLRVFTTLSEFYVKFRRSRGMEFTAYDTAFRTQCQRLKEVNAPLEGVVQAYWFLEKANISEELKRQVISGAGGQYDYSRLRQALVAIVPQVRKEQDEKPEDVRWSRGKSHRVNAVMDDEDEGSEPGAGRDAGGDGDQQEERVPEDLELEAEVLLTQAAKRRAEATKNRGFKKAESSADRDERIKELKSRMPCGACKAAGKTVFGHWHADPECPSRRADAKKSKPVYVVSQDVLEDESEDDAFLNDVMMAGSSSLRCLTDGVALADTACARTVAGFSWAKAHMDALADAGVPSLVVEDNQPFRFGDGPRVHAICGLIFPLFLPGQGKHVFLRASIVEDDVPLLVSSKALKALGALLDLEAEEYVFKRVKCKVPMISTASGHIGFNILPSGPFNVSELCSLDWMAFDNSMEEIAFGRMLKDRVVTHIPVCTRGPQNKQGLSGMSGANVNLCQRISRERVDATGFGSSESFAPSGATSIAALASDSCDGSQDQGRVCAGLERAHGDSSETVERADGREIAPSILHGEASTSESFAVELAPIQEGRARQDLPGCGDAILPHGTTRCYWTRDRFVVEILHYAEMIKEEQPEVIRDPEVPFCPKCQVPMTKRHNRMDGNPFWGCMTFPTCRETLAMTYNGVPAAKAQQQLHGGKGPGHGSGGKCSILESNEEMDGEMVRLARRVTVPEDASECSWDQVSKASAVELSPQELEIIQNLRKGEKTEK